MPAPVLNGENDDSARIICNAFYVQASPLVN